MTKNKSPIKQLEFLPLGATPTADGCYFAVWAPEARTVQVHFFTDTDEEFGHFSLPHYQDGIWSGFMPDLKAGTWYALETQGVDNAHQGCYFKSSRLLVDPYAKVLSKPFVYDAGLYASNSPHFIPKAMVPFPEDEFDWQGVGRPDTSKQGLILYELNVRSFTRCCKQLPAEIRGTYLGLCHPFVIEHLLRLGVNAVQLLPVAASMTEPYLEAAGLHNLWGYNPVCFMAPDPRYACNRTQICDEFRTMVRELHRHGIAVILDVVYNHTAEGGLDGPVLSYKGLDNKHYYTFSKARDYTGYLNVTGCGNSFNVDDRIGLKLVLDALRYWTEVMRVDGFRFDLALTCCRTQSALPADPPYAFNRNCAFLKACFADDRLRSQIMIAEPWDLGKGGYQLGKFPSQFKEQNDRFRDEVRRFWRKDEGMLSAFATRLMGSRDVFLNHRKPVSSSLNYITYHDGFTLQDLVSYAHKHNEANLSQNLDGTEENFSTNCGVEGATDDLKILEMRNQLRRNYLATLLLSLGTPHLLAGDELGHTQQGNNNAFCQDNRISYLDWELDESQQDFLYFVSRLCALRRQFELYNLPESLDYHQGEQAIFAEWYQPNGLPMSPAEWEDPQQRALLVHLGLEREPRKSFCLAVNNTEQQLHFALPKETYGRQWQTDLDTSTSTGQSNKLLAVPDVAAHSLKVLSLNSQSS